MTAPVRLQLSRRKGFDLQAVSLATNGLPAVNVARPSKWGNPFRVGHGVYLRFVYVEDAAQAVSLYREWLSCDDTDILVVPTALGGKNLACWCKPGEPCHGDVLLEIANPLSVTMGVTMETTV